MPESGSDTIVTVMTANVGAGLARDASILRAIHASRPGIVVFEELPRAQAHRLHRALDDAYPEAAFFADGNEGRGILSRYPIHEVEVLEIAIGRPDCRAEIMVDGTTGWANAKFLLQPGDTSDDTARLYPTPADRQGREAPPLARQRCGDRRCTKIFHGEHPPTRCRPRI